MLFLHIMKISPLVNNIESKEGIDLLAEAACNKGGVLICQSGRIIFSLDSKRYEMNSGDLLIIVPFSDLVVTSTSSDFKATLCMVDLDYIFSAMTPISLGANIQFVNLHPLSHPSPDDAYALTSIISLIEQRSKLASDRQLSELFIDNLIRAMAYLIMDSYLNVRQIDSKSSDTKESILATFHTHLSRDFVAHHNVAHYAELQNLTPRYFSTTIKAVSGYAPLFWINSALSAEAKHLMRESKLSIKEIAYTLNFPSPTFFTRWYRQLTGETPSKYRARCRIMVAPKN